MKYIKNFGWVAMLASLVVLVFVLSKEKGGPALPRNDKLVVETVTAQEFEKVVAGLKGKAVLINFWATWCGPCVREIPDLVRLYESRKAQGFEVLGVSTDTDPVAEVQDKARAHGMTYRVFYSVDAAQIGKRYGIGSGIPFTVILDAKGDVKESVTGARGLAEFDALVAKVLPGVSGDGAVTPPPIAVKEFDVEVHIIGAAGDPEVAAMRKAAEDTVAKRGMKLELDVMDPSVPKDQARMKELGYSAEPSPAAYICDRDMCFPPVKTAVELVKQIEGIKKFR